MPHDIGPSHDHDACIARSIKAAEEMARTQGLRFTDTRRRVLEILLEEHRAMGAYEILDRLKAEGRAAQPPTAYRALEFLTDHGLAHRIERLNAFVACSTPDSPHNPIFMICRSCDAVSEAGSSAAGAEIATAAGHAGFAITTCAIEAEGLCRDCAKDGA